MRALVRNIRHEPFDSFGCQLAQLEMAKIDICKSTLVSYLDNLGVESFVAAHEPRLTPQHAEKKLAWAKDKVDWADEQWMSVVWSDESEFNIVGNNGDTRVIRKESERYQSEHILLTTKLGSGSIIIWGCF